MDSNVKPIWGLRLNFQVRRLETNAHACGLEVLRGRSDFRQFYSMRRIVFDMLVTEIRELFFPPLAGGPAGEKKAARCVNNIFACLLILRFRIDYRERHSCARSKPKSTADFYSQKRLQL